MAQVKESTHHVPATALRSIEGIARLRVQGSPALHYRSVTHHLTTQTDCAGTPKQKMPLGDSQVSFLKQEPYSPPRLPATQSIHRIPGLCTYDAGAQKGPSPQR